MKKSNEYSKEDDEIIFDFRELQIFFVLDHILYEFICYTSIWSIFICYIYIWYIFICHPSVCCIIICLAFICFVIFELCTTLCCNFTDATKAVSSLNIEVLQFLNLIVTRRYVSLLSLPNSLDFMYF